MQSDRAAAVVVRGALTEIRELLVDEQPRVAEQQLAVDHRAPVGSEVAIQLARAEGPLVEVDGALGVADNQVRRDRVEVLGDGIYVGHGISFPGVGSTAVGTPRSAAARTSTLSRRASSASL